MGGRARSAAGLALAPGPGQRQRPPARPVSFSPLARSPHAPLTKSGLLALQRSAGNSAVAGLIAQREGEAATLDRLQSDRFTPSAKLELCFQNKARLGLKDSDTDAVRRVQQALVDAQAITGNVYDLGESGADGDYGQKTTAAVKKFKADENLGFTQFGDVGPGTMHRLDEMFKGGGGGGVDPPVTDEVLIEGGPPGVQVGPTPPESGSPGELPDYEPPSRRRGRVPPIFDIVGNNFDSSFADKAGAKTGDTTGAGRGGNLQEAIEQAVKKGIAENFKKKIDAIFAELRGQVSTVFERLKNLVKQTVRAGVNALVNAIAFAIGGPVGVAVVGVFKRAWKAISSWFGGKNDDPVNWLADQVSRLVTVYIDRLKKLADDTLVAQKQKIDGLELDKPIRGTVADLQSFIRGIGRSKVVENVRKIFGGYESVIGNLRENLKRLGFKLADIPVIGQVDSVAQSVNALLDPDSPTTG